LPATRPDDARTEVGSGLGLAIVKAIAEAHRGHAQIADGPTDVWLSLPRESVRASAP
jgi:signal transduction histidine kinase